MLVRELICIDIQLAIPLPRYFLFRLCLLKEYVCNFCQFISLNKDYLFIDLIMLGISRYIFISSHKKRFVLIFK